MQRFVQQSGIVRAQTAEFFGPPNNIRGIVPAHYLVAEVSEITLGIDCQEPQVFDAGATGIGFERRDQSSPESGFTAAVADDEGTQKAHLIELLKADRTERLALICTRPFRNQKMPEQVCTEIGDGQSGFVQ